MWDGFTPELSILPNVLVWGYPSSSFFPAAPNTPNTPSLLKKCPLLFSEAQLQVHLKTVYRAPSQPFVLLTISGDDISTHILKKSQLCNPSFRFPSKLHT